MKPLVIGMCHYGALPGDPGYDGKSLEEAADKMLADVVALQEGGVDVIMFSMKQVSHGCFIIHPVFYIPWLL